MDAAVDNFFAGISQKLLPYRMKWRRWMHNEYLRLIIGEFLFPFLIVFTVNAMGYNSFTKTSPQFLFDASFMCLIGLIVLIFILMPISGGIGNTCIAITYWWCRGQKTSHTIIMIPLHFLAGFIAVIILNVSYTDEVIHLSDVKATWTNIISEFFCQFFVMFFLLQLTYRGKWVIPMISMIYFLAIMSTPSGCIGNPYLAFSKIFMNSAG